MSRPVTPDDIRQAFLRATGGYCSSTRALWAECARTGMTDHDLAQTLAARIGEGGSGGRDSLTIEHTPVGLRIWAAWDGWPNPFTHTPVLQGSQTIAMARTVYGIGDSSQLNLFQPATPDGEEVGP